MNILGLDFTECPLEQMDQPGALRYYVQFGPYDFYIYNDGIDSKYYSSTLAYKFNEISSEIWMGAKGKSFEELIVNTFSKVVDYSVSNNTFSGYCINHSLKVVQIINTDPKFEIIKNLLNIKDILE